MKSTLFDYLPEEYQEKAYTFSEELILLALKEDGNDLTAQGIFDATDISTCKIIAKKETVICGLPLISMIFQAINVKAEIKFMVKEGQSLQANTEICRISAPTISLLKAERVILNFISHLSGIASLTKNYVQALENTGVYLLDTRKTLPGMRYLEKYAVYIAGGKNHRLDLEQMLMLKDNHIDAKKGIMQAVQAIRECYSPCPPLEIECRSLEDVLEAVHLNPDRIMLDNMDKATLKLCLTHIPTYIEAEISGNVNLQTIRELALVCPERKPNFISVGSITHSATSSDLSLQYITNIQD